MTPLFYYTIHTIFFCVCVNLRSCYPSKQYRYKKIKGILGLLVTRLTWKQALSSTFYYLPGKYQGILASFKPYLIL